MSSRRRLCVRSWRRTGRSRRCLLLSGLPAQTVGNWVGRYRRDHSTARNEEELRSESAEIRRLRAELRNARMENEFLKKAAAYFAREQK